MTSVQYILVSVKNQDTPPIHIKQPKNWKQIEENFLIIYVENKKHLDGILAERRKKTEFAVFIEQQRENEKW